MFRGRGGGPDRRGRGGGRPGSGRRRPFFLVGFASGPQVASSQLTECRGGEGGPGSAPSWGQERGGRGARLPPTSAHPPPARASRPGTAPAPGRGARRGVPGAGGRRVPAAARLVLPGRDRLGAPGHTPGSGGAGGGGTPGGRPGRMGPCEPRAEPSAGRNGGRGHPWGPGVRATRAFSARAPAPAVRKAALCPRIPASGLPIVSLPDWLARCNFQTPLWDRPWGAGRDLFPGSQTQNLASALLSFDLRRPSWPTQCGRDSDPISLVAKLRGEGTWPAHHQNLKELN